MSLPFQTTAINGGVVSTAQPVATVLPEYLLFSRRFHENHGLAMVVATLGVSGIISRGDSGVLTVLSQYW